MSGSSLTSSTRAMFIVLLFLHHISPAKSRSMAGQCGSSVSESMATTMEKEMSGRMLKQITKSGPPAPSKNKNKAQLQRLSPPSTI